ncbi:MAG: beta-ketoacyl-[acyl-carrier-protein] synthase II [Candidatus Marinimicrobia bacterium]|nr:beta-ketoacyl-[acyl-carrier-protein] synthase II [Candidatus Neomarinimicrobiota bacterium]|tara:strand:+ start:992 stop:2260 length:1269 start_codon:yes stop_codon:yes gene_type:complete
MKRVVVTGIGLVTPLGCGTDINWNNLISGVSGAAKIKKFDASEYKCQVSCEVPQGNQYEGSFVAEDWIDKKEIKKIDEFIKFSLAAGEEAFRQSKLVKINDPDSYRAGCIIGSGMGGLPGIEETSVSFNNGKKISPFFITGRIINMSSGYLSIKYNLKGPNYSTVSACASSAHAIGESYRLIQHGQADIMITGGSEATISPVGIEGFTACKALSTKFNNIPEHASRPFDEARDGFVMGEGAAILILEEMGHAISRDANILAEIAGYGMSSDAYHYTLPEPSGDGAYRAMINALNDAKIGSQEVDYINAHGTSTPSGDQVEALAIDYLFKNNKSKVNVSSTKSQIGHLLGAAGGVEAAYSIMCLNNKKAPYNLNLENEIETKNINFIKGKALDLDLKYILSNSFGFGGTNVSLVLKKFDERNL